MTDTIPIEQTSNAPGASGSEVTAFFSGLSNEQSLMLSGIVRDASEQFKIALQPHMGKEPLPMEQIIAHPEVRLVIKKISQQVMRLGIFDAEKSSQIVGQIYKDVIAKSEQRSIGAA